MASKGQSSKGSKASKAKKVKTLTSTGYVVSIKLRSTSRKGEQAYKDLVHYLFLKQVTRKVSGDVNVRIREYGEVTLAGKLVITGRICRFTKLDGKDWIDEKTNKVEAVEVPKDKSPNLREISYLFIPSAHRFFIEKSSKVSLPAVVKFLADGLKDALNPGEQIEVNVEYSRDAIDRIISAPAVERLEVEISYTNDDTNDEAADFIDQQLKTAKAGKANFVFEADAEKNINIGESSLLKGIVDLSRTNGKAKARIVNTNNKRETINTEQHPEIYEVPYKETESGEIEVAKNIIQRYREEE